MLVAPPCELKRLKNLGHEKYQNKKIEYLENNQLQGSFEGTSISLSDSAEAFFRNIALKSVINQLTRKRV